ncbi:MAG: hypothetical protein LBG52_00910 [Candidatus Peribacteria bacterium]|jgi:hypothetical protein|nr:hypothetical protein [Candidatus Peribacteria bacterium]
MKPKSSPLKKVLLKPTISALVFLSVLIVGAIGIWGLSALESLKSTENENKLTATMWDAMLDYVDVELA